MIGWVLLLGSLTEKSHWMLQSLSSCMIENFWDFILDLKETWAKYGFFFLNLKFGGIVSLSSVIGSGSKEVVSQSDSNPWTPSWIELNFLLVPNTLFSLKVELGMIHLLVYCLLSLYSSFNFISKMYTSSIFLNIFVYLLFFLMLFLSGIWLNVSWTTFSVFHNWCLLYYNLFKGSLFFSFHLAWFPEACLGWWSFHMHLCFPCFHVAYFSK